MTLSVSVYDTISQLESFIMVFYSVSGNMLYKSTGIIAKAMLAHSVVITSVQLVNLKMNSKCILVY